MIVHIHIMRENSRDIKIKNIFLHNTSTFIIIPRERREKSSLLMRNFDICYLEFGCIHMTMLFNF